MTVMRPDDPMRHSGAVWCQLHGRWECSKNSKRSQERCHQPAILGTATCRTHAGEKTELVKSRGQANLLAWSLLSSEHETAGQLDPADVVLRSLRVAVMRADFYAARLQELAAGDDHGPDALVGPTFAAGRDGQRVETGEQRRALTRLEAEERDRAVRFAKTAHDMGIDTRRLELEQAQASVVVTAVGLGLDAIPDLEPVQRDRFLEAFLAGIGRPVSLDDEPTVVAGEVEA